MPKQIVEAPAGPASVLGESGEYQHSNNHYEGANRQPWSQCAAVDAVDSNGTSVLLREAAAREMLQAERRVTVLAASGAGH
mmetsp:Transcript_52392/g.94316  ORF Transcript_52392/g.94316 Transcript_52392/m.94316 type:complete len:81 (-) Transcript_52392:122-364(-)